VTLESVVPAEPAAAPALGSVVRVCYNGPLTNAKLARRTVLAGCIASILQLWCQN
jgi:hypothetical protein